MATGTNCSDILSEVYQFSVDEGLQWTENVETLLSEIGLRQSFISRDPESHLKAFQRLQDIFHQTTLEKIKHDDSRLRTYALFKTTPGFEKYLDEISSLKERTALTKLRLSNHKLMIEKGRHTRPKTHKSLRLCPFCPDQVEDEKHFLIGCQTYKHFRSNLYNEVKNIYPTITNQPHEYRFLNLMGDANTVQISRFTSKAMELRDFLLNNHKMHG